MELTAENVNTIFFRCLFTKDEPTDEYIKGEGVMLSAGFHPERLSLNKKNIIDMLDCLPDDFKKEKGGGWSFANMCLDKNGNQWANLHETMDKLVTLGKAIGQLDFNLPRPLWAALHGGMPYIVIQ